MRIIHYTIIQPPLAFVRSGYIATRGTLEFMITTGFNHSRTAFHETNTHLLFLKLDDIHPSATNGLIFEGFPLRCPIYFQKLHHNHISNPTFQTMQLLRPSVTFHSSLLCVVGMCIVKGIPCVTVAATTSMNHPHQPPNNHPAPTISTLTPQVLDLPTEADAPMVFHQLPMSFMRSGYVYSGIGSVRFAGDNVRDWSASTYAKISEHAYDFYIDSSATAPAFHNDAVDGLPTLSTSLSMPFVRSGYVYSETGSIRWAGHNSVCWSSSTFPNSPINAYAIRFNTVNALPVDHYGKVDGFFIKFHPQVFYA